jgi:hypothetical protein
LVRTSDPYTRLKPGAEGTVIALDDAGTLHVRWDDGSTLGLTDEDEWDPLYDDSGPPEMSPESQAYEIGVGHGRVAPADQQDPDIDHVLIDVLIEDTGGSDATALVEAYAQGWYHGHGEVP